MNIKPLSDHVVLKPLKEAESKSGIVIAQTGTEEQPERGEVIAVGPGRLVKGERVAVDVKVGDVVIFKKYGPDEVEIEGEKFLIAKENEHILGIIE